MPFNAATLELLPKNAQIFLRPEHFKYLVDTIGAEKRAWLKEKTVLIPRNERLPAQVADVLDAVSIAWKHRSRADKTVLLSASSTTLAVFLAFRRYLGDVVVFAHSLDSILRKSTRASSLVRIGAYLGNVFSRKVPRFVLAFQRALTHQPLLVDLIRQTGVQVEVVHIPHPVAKVAETVPGVSSMRRFVYLGPPRPEKQPDIYQRIGKEYSDRSIQLVHISSQRYEWQSDRIDWLFAKKSLAESLSARDIVFCAYDDVHYDMTESGTFLDAVAVGAWALITTARADQLSQEYPGLFVILPAGNDYFLARPRKGTTATIQKICGDRLETILKIDRAVSKSSVH